MSGDLLEMVGAHGPVTRVVCRLPFPAASFLESASLAGGGADLGEAGLSHQESHRLLIPWSSGLLSECVRQLSPPEGGRYLRHSSLLTDSISQVFSMVCWL